MEELNRQGKPEEPSFFGPNNQNKEPDGEKQELIRGEWGFRTLCGALALVFLFFSFTYDQNEVPTNAMELVKARTNQSAPAGQKLFTDETNGEIAAKDFVVPAVGVGDDGGENKMHIWDFNLEDGDEVMISVDGKPIHEPFALKNDPNTFSIPATCLVTIKGVKDAGGGISYAVKFPQRKMTIYNVVPLNGVNTYRLVPQP